MEEGTKQINMKDSTKKKKIVYDYLIVKSLMKGKILKAEKIRNNYWSEQT